MSLRGTIVLECDERGCHGELVIGDLEFELAEGKRGIDLSVHAAGWVLYADANGEDKLVCPPCVEAANEEAERDAERASLRGYDPDAIAEKF